MLITTSSMTVDMHKFGEYYGEDEQFECGTSGGNSDGGGGG